MDKPLDKALVWLRRDLRVDDHAALYHALRGARQVWCAFVFDRDILDPLLAAGRRQDRRVEFIRDSLVGVDAELRALAASHGIEGGGLIVRHGRAQELVPALAAELGVQHYLGKPYAEEELLSLVAMYAGTGVAALAD